MMGYEIVETYQDEGFARTTRNRPSLTKLIKDARQRKFSMVISDELSRFAGTPVLLLNLLEELKLWNVHIVSVKESIDTSTPMGEMVSTLIAAMGTDLVVALKMLCCSFRIANISNSVQDAYVG